MNTPKLDASPVATFLLDLAERGCTGRVTIGQRCVTLIDGGVAGIGPGPDDDSLDEFLIKTGRIGPDQLDQIRGSEVDESSIGMRGIIADKDFRSLRRSLWLDRLVRGMRLAQETQEPLPTLDMELGPVTNATPVRLPALLLDALTRRAAEQDAAVVGSNLNDRLEWIEGPHTEPARRWAGFEQTSPRPPVSTILARQPAAAGAIAALVRAGVAQLSAPGEHAMPAAPRTETLPPPPPRESAIPPERRPSTMPPPADPLLDNRIVRAPRLRLDPGAAGEPVAPIEKIALRHFEMDAEPLDDPLTVVEGAIANLEDSRGAPTKLAERWVDLAELWWTRLGSLEEATRAYREAVAAHPVDAVILQRTALHCHRAGDRELALAYAEGATSACQPGPLRAQAHSLLARLHRASGSSTQCIDALCEAAAEDPPDPTPHLLLASMMWSSENATGAVAHTRMAARAIADIDPDGAIALLAWAVQMSPSDASAAQDFSALLQQRGRTEDAVAVLASAARHATDPDMCRQLRLEGAELAEATNLGAAAIELLAEAFDAEPHFDLLYAALDEDLKTHATPHQRAAVLEDVAGACPAFHRGTWLRRAGEAFAELAGQMETALWLCFESVRVDPRAREALDILRAHAQNDFSSLLLAHGLRAAIAGRLPGDPEGAAPLLEELARVAEDHLDNLHLAHAAWEQLSLLPRPPADAARHLQRLKPQIQDRDSARAPVDMPDHWDDFVNRLQTKLEGNPGDTETARELERRLMISGQHLRLAAHLEHRTQAETGQEQLRVLDRLASVHLYNRDVRAAGDVCSRMMTGGARSPLTLARLERAGRHLCDGALLRQAIAEQLSTASTATDRGRLQASVASALEQAADVDSAVGFADRALCEDPSCMAAALILLRHAQRLDPAAVLPIIERLGPLVGRPPHLLQLESSAAAATGDESREQRVLSDWQAAFPWDPIPRQALLSLRSKQNEPQALAEASRGALVGASPEAFSQVQDALPRLVEAGAVRDAAEIMLLLSERRGRVDSAEAEALLELATKAGDGTLQMRATERALLSATPQRRIELLAELARFHRGRRDALGESRALLRRLVLEPSAREVLERLGEIFARGRDGDRLIAILSLERDRAPNREAAHRLLLDMAAAAAQVEGDLDLAEYYVRTMIAECEGDSACVLRALGALFCLGDDNWAIQRGTAIARDSPVEIGAPILVLVATTVERRLNDPARALALAIDGAVSFPRSGELLLVVERLSLAQNDVEAALSTYERLIAAAVGPHGRRALHYRAGRWLERARRTDQAMAEYIKAFDLAPSAGVAYKAIERLAHATGDLSPLVQVSEQLADELRDLPMRVRLLQKTAELCHGLGEPRRAFDLLLRASQLSGDSALDEPLVQAARRVRSVEPDAAREVLEALGQNWEERLEKTWDGADKVELLLRLAEFHRVDRADPQQASSTLDRAEAVVAEGEVSAEIAARVKSLRGQEPTPRGHPIGRAARERSATNPGIAPASRFEGGAITQPGVADPGASPGTTQPGLAPQAARETQETALRSAADSGDADARMALAVLLANDGNRTDEVVSLLHQLVLDEPWRTEAARLLGRIASPPLSVAAAQLVATFDAETPEPTVGPMSAEAGRQLWPAATEDLQSPELDQLLSIIWDATAVMPAYRLPVEGYGVTARNRVTPSSTGPVVEHFAQVASWLGSGSTPLYLSDSDESTIRVVPTQPIAMIAPAKVSLSAHELRFEVALALTLATPPNLIACVLGEEPARALLLAVLAAFSRHSGVIDAKAAELAAGLWHSVPARQQAALNKTLGTDGPSLDYDALRGRGLSMGMRAGILAGQRPSLAFLRLAGLEGALQNLEVSQEADFGTACRTSALFSDLVRFVVSDAYLSALVASAAG